MKQRGQSVTQKSGTTSNKKEALAAKLTDFMFFVALRPKNATHVQLARSFLLSGLEPASDATCCMVLVLKSLDVRFICCCTDNNNYRAVELRPSQQSCEGKPSHKP